MPKSSAPMQSWQVFHYARKHLNRSVLYAIFGKKNARTVDYWCENPKFTNKTEQAYDPIQGVKDLLEQLDDQGHCPVVRAAIAYLVSGTSLDLGIDPEIIEPMQTIQDEILADYRAVASMQAAIEAGHHPDEISALKRAAIAEVERTFAKYREDYNK